MYQVSKFYLLSWMALGTAFSGRVQNIFNGLWWVQSWSHTSKLEHGLFQVFLSENAVVSVPKWFIFSLPMLTLHFQRVLPAAAEFSSPKIQSNFPPNLASLGPGVFKSSVETRLSNLECTWSQKGRSHGAVKPSPHN